MNIRELLEHEYQKRKGRNSQYTLRSFAQLLQTDSGSVVRVMNGKRKPGLALIEKWTQCLGLLVDPKELMVVEEVQHFTTLESDFFEKNYQWIHPIFLESLRIKKASTRKKIVSEALGLSSEQYDEILDFVISRGLVKVGQKNNYIPQSHTTYTLETTTEARKAIQKKYLQMAIDAIDNVTFENRCNSTLSVGISKNDIPEVKEILRKTRMKIGKLSKAKEKDIDTVYNVSIALYPVIREE